MDSSTEAVLCTLQAQLRVLRLPLRAMAATHQNPSTLLATWREVLSEVEPGADRDSAYLEELCRACAEDWTADLVDLTLPKLQTSEIAFAQDGTFSLQPPEA